MRTNRRSRTSLLAPAPRESEPTPVPSVPPAPSPVTASLPESVAAVPAPSVPEPAATPSEVQLDVASVCEDLFDPNRMSYETNRLFDDRYKDVTVRWKGTARRANPYSYDFNVWGRRRNEGRVRCLRGEGAVREPHGQGIRAAARRGRRRYWRSHRRGRALRRPSHLLRGFRETPVRCRRPHGGLNRSTHVELLERRARCHSHTHC